MASASSIHESEPLKTGALGPPGGIGWEGGRREAQDEGIHVHLWLIHVDIWQKPSQFCKVIILQLKLIN